MSPRLGAALAFVAGLALLLASGLRPPQGHCEPWHALPVLAVAAAQGFGFASLALLRRAAAGAAALGATGAAWAVACTAALMVRTCAGHFGAVGGLDAVHAAGGGIALALLCGGLSERGARVGVGAGTVTVLALGCAGAGIVATRLADGRASMRTWDTWARLDAAAIALSSSASSGGRMPPGDDTPLEEVVEALPSDAREGLETHDAWGQPIRYSLRNGTWSVSSLGSDGEPGPYSSGPSRDFVDDLIVENGDPVAWPESPCTGEPRPSPRKPQPIDLRGRKP